MNNEPDLPSGRVKALDEFLDLPHLNVLLRYILTHLGKRLLRTLLGDVCEDTKTLVDVDEKV